MNVLVTGGAGYIGSHAVRVLERAGHLVWVYDDLSRGHRHALSSERFVYGSLHERAKLVEALSRHQIQAVMHFAAFALVGESVENPALYYENNTLGSLHLLEAMRAAKVKRIVFSSTCATYGEPANGAAISEDTPQKPINPYGFSKLAVERMLDDYAAAYGFGFAALRYFNAAGAAENGEIGEDHTPESHLIPLVLQVALGQRPHVTIHGEDYPTPDGSCIRDYIHVDDLAVAHQLALEQIELGRGLKLNLGTGRGYSVKEVIAACRKETGHAIPAVVGPRRPGDPPILVADASRAARTLGWKPQHAALQSIIASAWRWHRAHPQGYHTRA